MTKLARSITIHFIACFVDNDTEKEIILENPSDEVQPRVNSTIINHQNVTTETELELKVQDIGDSTNSSVNSTLLPGVMSTPSPKHPVNSSDEGTVNTRVHGAQPTNTTYPPTVSIRSAKSKLSKSHLLYVFVYDQTLRYKTLK